MKSDSLLSILDAVSTISKENRENAAIKILRNNLVAKLVLFLGAKEEKLSIKSAWVLEWICTHHDLNLILPHLNTFTQNIGDLVFDSAIRPCAKICEHLAVAYTNKKENLVKLT